MYAAVEPVALRKGVDALATLVWSRLAQDPLSSSLFVFFNCRFDRAKVLVRTPTGWCLAYKRLEKGRFHLPRAIAAGAIAVTIDAAELVALLDGIERRGVRHADRWERTGPRGGRAAATAGRRFQGDPSATPRGPSRRRRASYSA